MATYLITGGARGLGLALTKQLASLPADQVSKIVVSVRKPSADLDTVVKGASGRVAVVEFDVTDEAAIQKAVPAVEAALGGKGLDVLINNSGISQYAGGGTKSMDTLLESIQVNVLGPHYVTRTFLPLLEKGRLKKVANMYAFSESPVVLAAANRFPLNLPFLVPPPSDPSASLRHTPGLRSQPTRSPRPP
jgi:NAD(P)-dependent dehydrogenase (short-subunit alcohol dehydrogenase family)